MTRKPTLLDRLTGSALADDPYDDLFEEEENIEAASASSPQTSTQSEKKHMKNDEVTEGNDTWETEMSDSGELPIDVYQTKNEVIIKALVAGVLPSNIDVEITRDMVTVKGKREEAKETEEDGYFQRELYWGEFSRTILLPEEVDVENAQATEKHGILMIRLPKIDKKKAAKLKVKSR